MTLKEVYAILVKAKEDPSIIGISKKSRWKVPEGRNGLRLNSPKWRIDYDIDGIYVAIIDKSSMLFINSSKAWNLIVPRKTCTIKDSERRDYAKYHLSLDADIEEISQGEFMDFAYDIKSVKR